MSASDLGPVLEFMRLMWAVNHGLDRTSRSMHAEFGVTGPQRLVLRVVQHYPGVSAGDLAKTLHMHPSTLTGILQRLVARGLLRRTQDRDDGRRIHLELTARGRRLTVPSVGTVEVAVKRVLSKWTPSELEAARRVLGELAQCLDPVPSGATRRRKEASR
jgi:DNA-binding MarR family transcriptional regulator